MLFMSSFAISVDGIVNRIEEVEKLPHSYSRIKQVITTSSGKKREFEIEGWAMDSSDKILQIYRKPARVRGEKILMLNGGDDIWAYSPKTDRVRHLATHMKKAKVMGSDFSYQDYAAGDYKERFTFKLRKDEKIESTKCYQLELIPTPKGPSYKKVIAWAGKKDFVARKMDFYDDKGLLKRLSVTEIKKVEQRLVPWKMVMEDLRNGGSTMIETLEMDLKTEPDPGMFSIDGLKKQ
jgi:outer membrane lipoprotein-sorting protein